MHVVDAVRRYAVVVFLNLSRDQLDRVGEINVIERTLRAGLTRHPKSLVVANCDDVLMTSAAYDSPNVVWVAAGGAWANDSVSCPRSGEVIVRDKGHWYSTGADFKRPSPQWWFDDDALCGPDGLALPMRMALPGAVNRGDAAQAVACRRRARRRSSGSRRGGLRRSAKSPAAIGPSVSVGATKARILLAKNPAGSQEALSMVDEHAAGVVISVNGQVPDGEDLSWLWDVRFEHLAGEPRVSRGESGEEQQREHTTVVAAAGERGADLAVRLGYAGVDHTLVHDTMAAIATCPPGGWRSSPTTPRFFSCSEHWRAMADTASDSKVRIGLVLPDVMGTYGDGGNALVLRQRLRLRGIAAEIVEVTLADPVPESLDLHAGRGGGLRAAAGHQAPSPVPRAAARGGPGCTGAGDLCGSPGARAVV